MQDSYGRRVKSFRISITQKCGLNCFYCHGEGQLDSSDEMTPDEIERIVSVGAKLGIKKVKITGGEPLERSDVVEVVERISRHVDEVSMTTNGVMLGVYCSDMVRNGLNRVNVSVDSLVPSRFRAVTGADLLDDALNGINEAIRCGLKVKLNVVMLRGINTDEVDEMARFAADNGAILQLIELTMPRCDQDSRFYRSYHVDLEAVERHFKERAVKTVLNEIHGRRKYFVPLNGGTNGNATCEVELVRPMHNKEFCAHCTRLRMTSDGRLKPCLLTNHGLVDILSAIRNDTCDEELESMFTKAIENRRPYWIEDEGAERSTEIIRPAESGLRTRDGVAIPPGICRG